MGTMVVGLLVVAAGAAGFGSALFGRRPVPQPATARGDRHLAGTATTGRAAARRARRPGTGLVPTRRERARAAVLLALTVLGLAALIGAMLSVVVVALVMLAT